MGSAGQSGENATVQQGFSDGTMAAAVIGTWMGPAIKKAIGEENVGAAKLPTFSVFCLQEKVVPLAMFNIALGSP